MEEAKKFTNMTPPILFASLDELRDRLLIARIEAGVTIVEESVKDLIDLLQQRSCLEISYITK